jgi:uncharacterized protein
MLNDVIIADATAHGFNWADSNHAIAGTAGVVETVYNFHRFISADTALHLTREEFIRDWPVQQVADVLFFESGVDLICHHGTPIFDFFIDGQTRTSKGYELKQIYPGRALAYAAINPFVMDSESEIRECIDRVADEGADGLKIYAARYSDGKTYSQRLDDESHAYPAIERALERGINVIATHKAVPLGPVHYEPYGVSDVPLACATFPEMRFEVVHTGMAFVEETVYLASAFPNCYFNLENSFSLIAPAPRRFAEFFGALLAAGAEDRILYSSGMAMNHPLIALRSFLAFQMPEDIVEGFGVPRVTDEIRRKVLGENYLRMHGIDPTEFRERIVGDEVSIKQQAGLAAPWSHIRAGRE